jgi:signal transduction histidine kinase
MRSLPTGSPTMWLRMSVVAVAVAVAAVQGLAATMLALGLAVLLLDALSARVASRSTHSRSTHSRSTYCLSRHRLAAGLVLLAAAIAGLATTVHVGTPTGAPLLLLIPAFRAGEVYGRLAAALCVVTAVTVSLGTAAMSGDLDPALEAGWLQWGGLALLGGVLGAWSASVHRSSVDRPSAPATEEPRAAREAAVLLRRLDTLAGALDGGFDAPASAELLLDAVDAAVPSRRRAVLVGFGHDPAVPLAVRGSDRVPWPYPALADPGPAGSLLSRVWRSGNAERGEMLLDGETRPLLAAALRDPMGDRIGVVVLERSPGATFDDAEVREVVGLAEAHGPNLDVSLIFAALRERAGFEERERLAREMHDGIAQELVALGYHIDVLRRRASRDGSPLAGELDELRDGFSETLADLRLQIADLRIAVRPDQGLGAVVGTRLQRFGSSTGLRAVLRLDESGFRLPAHVETMIYRLLLDLLNDARLAPGATSVDVTLDVAPPQVFLQVHHDGRTGLRAQDFREHPMTALGADILVEPHSPAGVVVQMHLRQRSSHGARPLTRERIPQRS